MKFLFVLAIMGAFAVPSAVSAKAQAEKPLLAAKIPLRADAPLLFAPRGWKIEKQVSGDLNLDKIADATLVLVENSPAKDGEGDATARQRALLVLLREGKGWRRAGFNNALLLGTRDGGAFYGAMETPVEVSIKRGVLNVSEENGSREITETTHRFRFDPRKNGFFLIGSELINRDRATGEVKTVSTNYLRGVRKTEEISGENHKTKRKTARVSRKLRRLEEIRSDERYAS